MEQFMSNTAENVSMYLYAAEKSYETASRVTVPWNKCRMKRWFGVRANQVRQTFILSLMWVWNVILYCIWIQLSFSIEPPLCGKFQNELTVNTNFGSNLSTLTIVTGSITLLEYDSTPLRKPSHRVRICFRLYRHHPSIPPRYPSFLSTTVRIIGITRILQVIHFFLFRSPRCSFSRLYTSTPILHLDENDIFSSG